MNTQQVILDKLDTLVHGLRVQMWAAVGTPDFQRCMDLWQTAVDVRFATSYVQQRARIDVMFPLPTLTDKTWNQL